MNSISRKLANTFIILLFISLCNTASISGRNGRYDDDDDDDDDDSDEDECDWKCLDEKLNDNGWNLENAITTVIVIVVLILFLLSGILCFCCTWCCLRHRKLRSKIVTVPAPVQQQIFMTHSQHPLHYNGNIGQNDTSHYPSSASNMVPRQYNQYNERNNDVSQIYDQPPPYYDVVNFYPTTPKTVPGGETT